MDNRGFDAWADGYERSVAQSDAERTYPFAGYGQVLETIFGMVGENETVLDIGFGTGTLTARLYAKGCDVWGQDFSSRMIELAQEKMPRAHLFEGDFTLGLAEPLLHHTYDCIVATYSLHHLKDEDKPGFLKALLPLLREGGRILIGDVAFATREQMERCKAEAGDAWDDQEFYPVYEELRRSLPSLQFEAVSFCAGVYILER